MGRELGEVFEGEGLEMGEELVEVTVGGIVTQFGQTLVDKVGWGVPDVEIEAQEGIDFVFGQTGGVAIGGFELLVDGGVVLLQTQCLDVGLAVVSADQLGEVLVFLFLYV